MDKTLTQKCEEHIPLTLVLGSCSIQIETLEVLASDYILPHLKEKLTKTLFKDVTIVVIGMGKRQTNVSPWRHLEIII